MPETLNLSASSKVCASSPSRIGRSHRNRCRSRRTSAGCALRSSSRVRMGGSPASVSGKTGAVAPAGHAQSSACGSLWAIHALRLRGSGSCRLTPLSPTSASRQEVRQPAQHDGRDGTRIWAGASAQRTRRDGVLAQPLGGHRQTAFAPARAVCSAVSDPVRVVDRRHGFDGHQDRRQVFSW
jgi:hypothetical protein